MLACCRDTVTRSNGFKIIRSRGRPINTHQASTGGALHVNSQEKRRRGGTTQQDQRSFCENSSASFKRSLNVKFVFIYTLHNIIVCDLSPHHHLTDPVGVHWSTLYTWYAHLPQRYDDHPTRLIISKFNPNNHQAVPRSQSLILLQTVSAFAPSLLQHKVYVTTKGARASKMLSVSSRFLGSPKRSSVFPSTCEKAQIGFFKCGPSTLWRFFRPFLACWTKRLAPLAIWENLVDPRNKIGK